jgi:hypothetical protein
MGVACSTHWRSGICTQNFSKECEGKMNDTGIDGHIIFKMKLKQIQREAVE